MSLFNAYHIEAATIASFISVSIECRHCLLSVGHFLMPNDFQCPTAAASFHSIDALQLVHDSVSGLMKKFRD